MSVQPAKYFEPVREINELALDNVEKLLDIQLKSLNDTARLSLEQLRSATDIKDVDGLKQYITEQADLVKSLGERFVKDSQTALELGVSYTDRVQQIVSDSIKQEVPVQAATRARPVSETAAKAAPKSK